MTEDTPGTRPDPELGTEGDGNQLPTEDTLLDRGTRDFLDEGYSPPDRPRQNHWGETQWEESHGEPLDQRLAQEEPESWDRDPLSRADTSRAGRLVADGDADPGADGARDNDVYGADAGIDGAGATAEEAAVHWVQEP
ncbi:DUF5709 domain-containing protein [Isoptericola halotolerans]|uniref:DUF5709 domain-containing protein n=1 Tax=Isoptericola halotolerans TaxID=300560 RepID=A0ABX2A0E1_9MICO|nr:DUF5709 domain-containing protein [Isoptericola halotolerans]NOV96259.1 hypothetical protein [Isoptericola halotolerans]